MSKMRIGSPILCRDGHEVGQVDRVVIDPISGRLTDLISRASGVLLRDVVIPIGAVRDWDEQGVFLELGCIEVEGMADYVEDNFVSPASEEMTVGAYHHGEVLFPVTHVRRAGPDQLLLGKLVECRDGVCGKVEEVLIDPVTRHALSFRLGRGGLLTRDVIVPIEWVADLRGERVRLACSVSQLEDLLLPAQKPEREQSA